VASGFTRVTVQKHFMRRFRLLRFAVAMDPVLALRCLVWRLMGKRVRSRNKVLLAASRHPDFHLFWSRYVEAMQIAEALNGEQAMLYRYGIVIRGGASVAMAQLQETLNGIGSTFGEDCVVAIVGHDDLSNPAAALPYTQAATYRLALDTVLAGGVDYVVTIDAGDSLSPYARTLSHHLEMSGRPAIAYWDEDFLDRRGRRNRPWFKPCWNLLQFIGDDYLTGASALRADAVQAALQQLPAPDLVPECLTIAVLAQREEDPVQIPHIFIHRFRAPSSANEARRHCLEDWLQTPVVLEILPSSDPVMRVQGQLPSPAPSVSIIVPTRDQLALLRRCVAGVREIVYDGEVELIIMDNESQDSDTLRFLDTLEQEGVRVIRHVGAFNYSAINNAAVAEARNPYLCFLNNDIEMLDETWFSRLMTFAVRPEVGAVGAKLLYPDDTIQHAGVVLGLGNAAGHIYRNQGKDERGYFNQAHLDRYVTAATAACLVVSREKFLAVGGFDPEHFGVAFSDVDLCLKLDRAGWKNVYAAGAVLVHHESKSRGSDMERRNIDRYRRELANLQRIWQTETVRDRYHNPNLSRASEQIMVAV